jgi:D-alanine-D-alanine ligase
MSPANRIQSVLVVDGGWSHEAVHRFTSGPSVVGALARLPVTVDVLELQSPSFLEQLINRVPGVDVVFPVTLGSFGEDGRLQSVLELLGVPYVGSGVATSALFSNKWMAKRILTEMGVFTPKDLLVRRRDPIPEFELARDLLGPVLVIKPVFSGASLGISVVANALAYALAVRSAQARYGDVLLEPYIEGREYTASVVEDERRTIALPICEQVEVPGVHDTDSKLRARYRFPDPAEAEIERLRALALQIHLRFCRGLSRVDAIVSDDEKIVVLEVNTIPGLLPFSALPAAARHAGIDEPELYEMLLASAYRGDPFEESRHVERQQALAWREADQPDPDLERMATAQ